LAFQERRANIKRLSLATPALQLPDVWMLIKYGVRRDLKNEGRVTAPEIVTRKIDPEFRDVAAQLLAGS
jgi:hypothetical protein